jgi:hypothetical protein
MATDNRLLTQTHGPRSLVAACLAWVPDTQVGDRDREDEPSLPILPWPAALPVSPAYSFAPGADKGSLDRR